MKLSILSISDHLQAIISVVINNNRLYMISIIAKCVQFIDSIKQKHQQNSKILHNIIVIQL